MTKEGKVPLANFPSPEPGQCNEAADRWDLEADWVAAVSVPAPATAELFASRRHQDLEPLPFPLEELDGFELVEKPRPPLPRPIRLENAVLPRHSEKACEGENHSAGLSGALTSPSSWWSQDDESRTLLSS